MIAVGAACAAVIAIGHGRAARPEPKARSGDPPPSNTLAAMPQPSDPAAVATALTECRSQVLAAEQVIGTADTGIGHWNEHVQAQTDFNKGRLTFKGMQDIYDQTADQGTADQQAWEAAAASWKSDPEACRPIIGANGQQRAVLVDCAIRLTALEQAMPDGTAAMKDWTNHLADAHHGEKDPNAEQNWLHAWKAAGPNIDEWQNEQDEIAKQPVCKA